MSAVQGPDSLKAMNAMLDAPVDDLKRFGICERKLGGIPVYIHRSGFTGENGYEIYSAFDKSAEVHDLALKAVEAIGARAQTLEVYVRSIPMEKGFALKQDFKHLSPYECGLGWAVAADKDFIGKEAALARKEHPKYRMVGLEFSRESTGGHLHLGAGILVALRSAAARRPSTATPWTETLASPPSARTCQTVRS